MSAAEPAREACVSEQMSEVCEWTSEVCKQMSEVSEQTSEVCTVQANK